MAPRNCTNCGSDAAAAPGTTTLDSPFHCCPSLTLRITYAEALSKIFVLPPLGLEPGSFTLCTGCAGMVESLIRIYGQLTALCRAQAQGCQWFYILRERASSAFLELEQEQGDLKPDPELSPFPQGADAHDDEDDFDEFFPPSAPAPEPPDLQNQLKREAINRLAFVKIQRCDEKDGSKPKPQGFQVSESEFELSDPGTDTGADYKSPQKKRRRRSHKSEDPDVHVKYSIPKTPGGKPRKKRKRRAVPSKCRWCPSQDFSNRAEYTTHIQSHANEPGVPTCTQCKRVFAEPWLLKNHVGTVHNQNQGLNKTNPNPPVPCPCPICSKLLGSKSSLKGHYAWKHPEQLSASGAALGGTYERRRKRPRYPVPSQCRYCPMTSGSPETFSTRREYLAHIQSHGGGPEVPTCPYDGCGKVLPEKWLLKDHIERIHEKSISTNHKQVSCPTCGLLLSDKYSLKGHVELKHPAVPRGKDFICDQCGKGWVVEYELTRHIRRCHPPPDQLFPCPEHNCQFTTQNLRNLQNHFLSIHSDQSTRDSFQCHSCPKIFKTRQGLYEHFQCTHENKRRWICSAFGSDSCGNKRFNIKKHLFQHIMQVHGPNIDRTTALEITNRKESQTDEVFIPEEPKKDKGKKRSKKLV